MHKNNLNKVRTKENSKIKIIGYTKKNKIYHNTKIEQSTKIKNDEFYIETFNIMIQDNPKSKGKNTSFFNDDSILNNKSAFNQLSPSKFDKNILSKRKAIVDDRTLRRNIVMQEILRDPGALSLPVKPNSPCAVIYMISSYDRIYGCMQLDSANLCP